MQREALAEGQQVKPIPKRRCRPVASRAAKSKTTLFGNELVEDSKVRRQVQRLVERFGLPPATARAVATLAYEVRP